MADEIKNGECIYINHRSLPFTAFYLTLYHLILCLHIYVSDGFVLPTCCLYFATLVDNI